jgi:hypothetical protein
MQKLSNHLDGRPSPTPLSDPVENQKAATQGEADSAVAHNHSPAGSTPAPATKPSPARESFQLQITAEPGHWQSLPEMRLKALLKSLHRSYGFRCDSCQPVKFSQDPPKSET